MKLVGGREGKMDGYGAEFAGFYDRFFGDYAERAAPLLLRYFAAHSASEKYPRVLDLGCGTGRLALRFLEAGYEVTGLDLSTDMLALAEGRCARHLVSGKVEFLKGDLSNFHLEGPFGLILSTYNSMNHLDSLQKLEGCFRSVRACLAPEGSFLFDYHTLKGLREWVYSESTQWEEGRMESTGTFEESVGKATMRLKGEFKGKPLDEGMTNFTFPTRGLAERLGASGFGRVVFAGMEDLSRPLEEPEDHKRIVVIASL